MIATRLASEPRPGTDLIEVVRVLLLVQVGVLAAAVLEALIWAAAFGPAAGSAVILSLAATVAAVAGSVGIGRGARWARRVVIALQVAVLLFAAADTVLSLFIAHAAPPLMTLLTRVVLPVAVIGLLRQPSVRAVFSGARR